MKVFTRAEKTKHPDMIAHYEQLIKDGVKPNKAERIARDKYNIPRS